MAILHTALLADKFLGLTCMFFLFWMIPDVIIEWHPQSESRNSSHLLLRNNSTEPLPAARMVLVQPPPSSLFALPEEWSRQGAATQDKYISMLKHFLVSDSKSMELLSTLESLAEKTANLDGDFVELGTSAPPAIIVQAAWRMHFQRRKILLLAESIAPIHREAVQRELFQQAGVLDSNVMIVDDLPSAVHHHVGSIAILLMNESLLDNTVFHNLYARVPVGGYVIINNWRDDLFDDPVPGIVLVTDGTIAFWEKTKANADMRLTSRLRNGKQSKLRSALR